MARRRKFWGWGFEDQQPAHEEVKAAAAGAREHLGFGPEEVERPARLEDIELRPPRLEAPESLAAICRNDPYERAAHAYGKSYRDVVRAFRGHFENPPDVVAHPGGEAELERVLAWCEEAGAVAIPFGGGTSVVGGVEPPADRPTVSIDIKAMNRVLEVDSTSRAALIQAGATGPHLEEQLREHGLTLRHFPQSFEYSTLGGWIATRAGGHFATLHTHIDDFVESVRACTPRGWWESRRLPASGAGPSPDRMLIGSEGILGVITEAWVRVQDAPRFRESAAVLFDSFETGAQAVRALSQSGLHPSNCRLLDPGEAALSGAAPDGGCVLVLGVESAHHPVESRLTELLDVVRDSGGTPRPSAGGRDEAADAWRSAFLRMPYVRDGLARMSAIVETFETACTWDRAEELYATVRAEVSAAVEEVTGASGLVNCRLTHVYPDGPAPYFTVVAAGRPGSEVAMWDDVKTAASEVLGRLGATITHHHAVGRDHRPGYDRQRPEPFAVALRAAKAALDPTGMLNPGVLIDPTRGAERD